MPSAERNDWFLLAFKKYKWVNEFQKAKRRIYGVSVFYFLDSQIGLVLVTGLV